MMESPDMRTTEPTPLQAALEAGERAPSVCNTRPWNLSEERGRIIVATDPERLLDVADPRARELVISCGAALYNIRVGMRAQGSVPEVAILSDAERPGRLAEVAPGLAVPPDEESRAHAAAIPRRRTHRGPFSADIDDVMLARDLTAAAAAEGATLQPLTAEPLIRALSGLVTAAEHLHRHERVRTAELARWVRSAGSRRAEGVHAGDFPPDPDSGLFPGRDYGQQRIRGMLDVQGTVTGTVALLTTPGDTRGSWIAAGQALERVLLAAAAEGVAAAFHTQPLEEEALRSFIAERICGGAYPQMILRLGRPRPRGARPVAPSRPH